MTPSEIRQAVEWACILEATAQKPGNVHPRASFADLDYLDFVRAAIACSEPLSNAGELGVGRAVFEAVTATRAVARSNVNLGIVLLLAPLCNAASELGSRPTRSELQIRTSQILKSLSVEDAEWAFKAIASVRPGGLGEVAEQDVHSMPSVTLLEAMALAADRDSIARQYWNGFEDVFGIGVKALSVASQRGYEWEKSILFSFLALLASIPDSHIDRKLGPAIAEESQRRARAVSDPSIDAETVRELDAWLRADGNKRNPGASADLTAASLFVAYVSGVFPKR